MKHHIEIDTKTFVRFWLVVIGFVLAAWIIVSAMQALTVLGLAFFLALALNKPVSALANLLPGKSRIGGTAIAYVLIVAVLGAVLFLVIPPFVEQSAKVVGSVPAIVDQVQSQWTGVRDIAGHYGLQSQFDNGLNDVKSKATEYAASLGTILVSSIGSLLSFLATTFLVLVLSFLMLIEAPRWLNYIWNAYNNERTMQYHKRLAHRMYNVVTGYVTGQLAVSAIDGFFAGITVFILSWLFNVPHNFALPAAAICFVLSLIPMFGATIAGILVAVLLAFYDLSAALIFAIYFVIYQQIENNFISPTIQAKTVELSALAVLIAVTIGLYLFGIAGGIISIPIAGCVKVLVEDYLDRAKANRSDTRKPHGKLAAAKSEA